MNVRIESIRIQNFKGIRHAEYFFNDGLNEFRGDNGTGKTTIADAIFWCLYEKDTQGRTDFDIKRLDKDGSIIMRETHEVSVNINADGKSITITRTLNEDWVRRRGDVEETFKGNTIDRTIDGVPMSKKDFDAELAKIASEEVMKMTILPLYFLNQKKEFQRDFLVKMAGDIKPEDIVKEHPEWSWIIESGKTTSDLEKSLGASIKTIKTKIDGIPDRIDENNRNMPTEEDWDAIEKEIADKKSHIESLEKQLADKAEAYNAQSEEKQNLSKQLAEASQAVTDRKLELQKENAGNYVEQSKQQTQLKSEMVHLQAQKSSNNSKVDALTTEIQDLENARAMKLHEYHDINSQKFYMPEGSLICPTCGQELPTDKAEEKKMELQNNWNNHHAEELTKCINEGKSIKLQIENKQSEIAKLQDETTKLDARMTEIKNIPLFSAELKQDLTNEEDAVLTRLMEQENALRIKYNSYELKTPDNSYINSQKSTLNIDIAKLNVKLASRDRIKEIQRRNEELATERDNSLNEVSLLEKKQHMLSVYKKAYMNAVEESVNSLFSFVRWKMYEPQINGGEKETCIATVDGVPYGRSLNSASCINAGIDVINTIANYYNVHTMVIVDNAETIVTMTETPAQVIRLVVDGQHKSLIKTI